jgi:surface antigen
MTVMTPKLEICARLREAAEPKTYRRATRTARTPYDAELMEGAAALIETLVAALERGLVSHEGGIRLKKGACCSAADAMIDALATARQAGSESPLSPYPETGSGDE